MVFYRKFRPQNFATLVGQEHVIKTLTNALASSTFSHGYLFAGPRGSGKTTLARIFAKALNCSGRKLEEGSFEPCNKCEICTEITLGKSLDIIEIDAASNRGIDEIRDLREKIRFAPTRSRYKVYIIDEVHMLTKEAFNALLKTLEEPPSHAVFILATTEPHKILPTILSRVQRFDFHRAKLSELKELIEKVAKLEKIKITADAVELLSQLAFGSYRDSLSLFGQIASLQKTASASITVEDIQEVLGLAQEKSIFDFIEFLSVKDRKKAFNLVSQLYLEGCDLENFTLKLIEILRKIALLKLGENQLFDLTQEQQEQTRKLAECFEVQDLMKMVEKFTLAAAQIKSAHLPQLPLEILIYEFTTENQKLNIKNQNDKEKIQNELSEPSVAQSNSPRASRMVSDNESEGEPERVGSSDSLESETAGTFDVTVASDNTKTKSQLDKNLWPEIVKEAKAHNHSLSALLKDAILAEIKDETIVLAFKFKFHASMIAKKNNAQVIENIIAKITNSRYQIDCIVDPQLVVNTPRDSEEELLSGAKEVFEVED